MRSWCGAVSTFSNNNWRAHLADTLRASGPLQTGAIVLGAVVLGCVVGAAVTFGPFWAGFAALAALAAGYVVLRSTDAGMAAVILIAVVVPFGAMPFKAVITPNFLELALLALLGVWLLRLLLDPEMTLQLTPLGLPIIGFLGLTLFSFILGSNGSPDSLLLHNYFKFVWAVLFFFCVVNCVRNRDQARFVLRWLLIGGAVSAAIGLLLYTLSNDLSLRALVALGRFGYPTEGRVLRFVEDDIYGLERAIGLAVDPNSYGGMLALIGAFAATQVVAEKPLFRRWLVAAMAGIMLLVLFLTYSRAALGGVIIAAMYVATVRYRQLWWAIIGAGVAGLVLAVGFGIGQAFVVRVTEGIQFRDQANQMRLAEYANAIAVIQEYPVFGIGFGSAPQFDLVAGVSSIYLAMGQRIGLVGLAAFLVIIGVWFVRVWHAMHRANQSGDTEMGAWQLGLQAAIVAALAVGVLDHYFFNIEFSHMVALFWGTIGLAMALENLENYS